MGGVHKWGYLQIIHVNKIFRYKTIHFGVPPWLWKQPHANNTIPNAYPSQSSARLTKTRPPDSSRSRNPLLFYFQYFWSISVDHARSLKPCIFFSFISMAVGSFPLASGSLWSSHEKWLNVSIGFRSIIINFQTATVMPNSARLRSGSFGSSQCKNHHLSVVPSKPRFSYPKISLYVTHPRFSHMYVS